MIFVHVASNKIHKKTIKFLREFYGQKQQIWTKRNRDSIKDSQILEADWKTTQLQTNANFLKKINFSNHTTPNMGLAPPHQDQELQALPSELARDPTNANF